MVNLRNRLDAIEEGVQPLFERCCIRSRDTRSLVGTVTIFLIGHAVRVFIRRSFDDNPLYKAVFRSYLAFLIREGYTQEFFIEGGRSRTGKILTPKLGMLSAIVNAFVGGVRRDLFLVPVSIYYERVVEEEAYKRELVGAENFFLFGMMAEEVVARHAAAEYRVYMIGFTPGFAYLGGLDPALPFGGFKQSGWGRENGREGIDAYTETKSVAIAI